MYRPRSRCTRRLRAVKAVFHMHPGTFGHQLLETQTPYVSLLFLLALSGYVHSLTDVGRENLSTVLKCRSRRHISILGEELWGIDI